MHDIILVFASHIWQLVSILLSMSLLCLNWNSPFSNMHYIEIKHLLLQITLSYYCTFWCELGSWVPFAWYHSLLYIHILVIYHLLWINAVHSWSSTTYLSPLHYSSCQLAFVIACPNCIKLESNRLLKREAQEPLSFLWNFSFVLCYCKCSASCSDGLLCLFNFLLLFTWLLISRCSPSRHNGYLQVLFHITYPNCACCSFTAHRCSDFSVLHVEDFRIMSWSVACETYVCKGRSFCFCMSWYVVNNYSWIGYKGVCIRFLF